MYEFHKDELQPKEELAALEAKANSPCDRHESGGCDCGKAEKRPETRTDTRRKRR
jgi:hypothetical protein